MIIGVDVDLTVVGSDRQWFDWCNFRCRDNLNYDEVMASGKPVPYDFGQLFGFANPANAMDFWHNEHLYDNMLPIEGAIAALKLLSQHHEIVFVSKITGNHYQSKVDFIERYFPFAHGFIGTSDKHYARVDVLIDDRVDHLNKAHQRGIRPIQYMTPYLQDESPVVGMPCIKSWKDVLCADSCSLYNMLFTNIRKVS